MELVNIPTSTKGKVLIIALVIFGFFVVAGAIGSITLRKANPSDITGITQFVVINDNGLYKVRFSLTDQNNALVSSDAHVRFNMTEFNETASGSSSPMSPISESGYTEVYHSDENIKAYQFQDVRLLLTGATLLAYSWQIKPEWVHGNPDSATVQVTLPDGKRLAAQTRII
jgi:hypothetical protein